MMNRESVAADGLLALPDDVLGHVASQLHDPGALLSLALTNKRVQIAVEGAAQAFVNAHATSDERENLPLVNLPSEKGAGREWGAIARYQQVLKHREGLKFDQVVGGVERRGGDGSRLYASPAKSAGVAHGFGTSDRVMRSGVHRAAFEVGDTSSGLTLGIARPMHYDDESQYVDVTRAKPRDEGVKRRYPLEWHAETKINVALCTDLGLVFLCRGKKNATRFLRREKGSRSKFCSGDRVGLILDMDEGTLSLCRNGNDACEIVSGLDGEYVWAAGAGNDAGSKTPFVRICDWS